VELSQTLKETLGRLLESGPVKVQENGSWLAPFENFQYEVRERRARLCCICGLKKAHWSVAQLVSMLMMTAA
jgi:hypothetical protein